ncbi:Uncharacterised protein [Vibrio cholerae]|nr:Uncharacterised protein [Vibrio cholerae]
MHNHGHADNRADLGRVRCHLQSAKYADDG